MKSPIEVGGTRGSALWFEAALLPDGWASAVRLAHSHGHVISVATGVPSESGDERHAIGLPGLPNLHSHAFQRALAGLTEHRGAGNDSFWSWRERMYQFVDRLQPDDIEAITALAYVEMLESGFTQVGEFHYLHHALDGSLYDNPAEHALRVAAAADQTGIGLTLLPVFYAHSGFGGLAPANSQRRFVNDLDSYARLLESSRAAASQLGGAVVGVAAHSLRAVTPQQLVEVARLAQSSPIHIHAAEQQREVADCLAMLGVRPVEWLVREAGVGPQWCLVHATHMTPVERDALAASGAVAGLCPITEANLGDGIPDVSAYLQAGGRFGIGSDSNVLIDAAGELRLLEYGQRLQLQSRNALATGGLRSTGRTLFDAAYAGGTQALGIPGRGLVTGARADFVSLDATHLSLIAREGDALLDSWIFAGGGKAIDCVWRNGEKLVANGRHRSRDAVARRYATTLRRLLS